MKKIVIILSLIISCLVFAENNPLQRYVSDKTYQEGVSKFPKKKDMFKTKVYSLNAIRKEIEEARKSIQNSFKEVTFILKQGEKWVSTFYYIDETGTKKRKTVVGREKLYIGKKAYLIQPYEQGVKVTDLRTKVELSIEKKGR